jgi:hypothetical protein
MAMSGASRVGTLLLSVDLEPDLEHQGDRADQLDQVRRRLLELFGSHAIPATWAVADPVLSVATESILAAAAGHEIAVLGDRAWLGPGCGRLRLSRELTRSFDGARKAGIPVSTLALHNLDQVRDLDLLLDHGVTALRGAAPKEPTTEVSHCAAPIRFGIWQTPAGRSIPAHSAWWLPRGWSICRELKLTIAKTSVIHLQINAAELAEAGERELLALARILRFAAARREAGQLHIATIQQVAASLLAERSAAPSRSILRPAA